MKKIITLFFFLATHSIFAQVERTDTEYEKGTIIDGYKAGIWEYYDTPGELALKINYNSAKLLFFKADTTDYVIKVREKWITSRLDRPARYIGSMNDFQKAYAGIQYPVEARLNETAGRFYIAFEIDTTGKAGNFQVINDIGNHCSEQVIKALKKLPNFWLPAQKNGQVYAAKFILPVTFKMVFNDKEVSPKKVNYHMEPPLAKELKELVITTIGKPR